MTTTNDTRDGSTSAPSAGSDADFVADTNRSFLSRLYTGTGAFEIVGRRRMWYGVTAAILLDFRLRLQQSSAFRPTG